MPNENALCGCGVVVDLPNLRNGALSSRKLTNRIQKSKTGKPDGRPAKKQHLQEDARASKNRSFETGSSSSVAEQARPASKAKHEKRLNHARRTRSADRAESHYTYIDCGSCIVGGGIRENVIPEALYATIPDTPNARANESGNSQLNAQRRAQPVYAIPSMVSPPPTYDVAISKTCQSGLPPTYEEYLCHAKYAISRSHTPPPPWSDSSATTPALNVHSRREMLASQPELREHLAQLSLGHNQSSERPNAAHYRHNHQGEVLRDNNYLSNQQASREQQGRTHHHRTRDSMPPRSQSASRVQNQRIATMYEDGAFCMETTALLSAFENAGCSLM